MADEYDDFEHTFLVTMVTLAAGLRYMMDSRPLESGDEPPGEEAPAETKAEKVVAIGGKKQ
jgi:hypothetical protein